MLSFASQTEKISAELVNDKFNVEVSINPMKEIYEANESISIIMSFSAKDSSVHVNGGDTLTISWGSTDSKVKFDPNKHSNIELKNNEDKVLGYATITESGATVTFSNQVESLHSLDGELQINGYVRNNRATDEDNGTVKVSYGVSKTIDINIKPGGTDVGTPYTLKKTGYAFTVENDNTVYFCWTLLINMEYKNDFTSDAVIKDSLTGKGHVFFEEEDLVGEMYLRVTNKDKKTVAEDVEIDGINVCDYRYTKGYYYGTNKDEYWANHNNQFVADFRNNSKMEEYIGIEFVSDEEMIITIPKDKINNHFLEVVYYTTPTTQNPDGIYENNAIMTYNTTTENNTTDNWSDDIHFEDSSGRMSGITTETFKLVKYEEGTTTPIQGATFKIKREDNKPFKDGDLEKEITTDEKGEAVVHNLAPGNYVVWEISAPNAYVISNEKYNFTMHREQVTHTFYNKKKDKLDIPVEKVWQDYDNKNNLRPTKLRVGLYANGYEVDSVYLSEDNNWKHTFLDLESKDDNGEIIYYVNEEIVEGYYSDIQGDKNEGFVITNTYENDMEHGSFILRETVSGKAEVEKEYEFTVEITYPDSTKETIDNVVIRPKETVKFIDLPLGTKIKVVENTKGYITTYQVNDKQTQELSIDDNLTYIMVVNNHKPDEPRIPKTGIE